MTWWHALILGIVQGLTEFLPVSSSGHLILVPWLFGWEWSFAHADLNKTFDVALHFGTFIAVLAYFWRQVISILRSWGHSLAKRRIENAEERLAWLLLLSTVPAGLVGVAFESFVEDQLGKPILIVALMFAFAIVMYVADRYAHHTKSMADLRWGGALGIGVAQAVALAPGVSRSGITMVTGLFIGLNREAAARYSFLLSVPVVGGAAAVKGVELANSGMPHGMAVPFLVGMAAAAVSGFAAIWFLLGYLRRHTFKIFVIYRLVVATALLIVIATGFRHATGI
jgi:undecaprenyl-diphosphatase